MHHEVNQYSIEKDAFPGVMGIFRLAKLLHNVFSFSWRIESINIGWK